MKKWIAAMLAACLLVVPARAADEPSSWAQEAVQTARDAGLVPEELDSAYTQPITRAEFCALAAAVYRSWAASDRLGASAQVDVQFTDCTDEDVLLCASLGIVNGVGDGRFEPDRSISRQEAASMLHRLGMLRADYDSSVQGRLPHVFADGADIASWARNDISWVCRHGIMNGVSGNAFDTQGEYTREQSIATILRLYDAQYALTVPAEQEDLYRVVNDYTGAGVGRAHLEDVYGNRLLTDFEGTDGYFNMVSLFGDWAALQWTQEGNNPIASALYSLKNGSVLMDYNLYGEDASSGTAWAFNWVNSSPDRCILYADGTYSTETYRPVTDWADGRTIVQDGNAVRAIDRDGNSLWRINISLDQVEATSGSGDRMVIQRDGMYSLIADGKMGAVSAGPMLLNRWSDTYIGQNGGYYALYDFSGKQLTQAYPNAMDEVGQDIYSCWVSDSEYTYIRCTASGSPQTLFTVPVTQRPGDLATDGAGVYAVKAGERRVICFDGMGNQLGIIDAPFAVDGVNGISFENGCIRLTHPSTGADDPAQTAFYLPTGEQVE